MSFLKNKIKFSSPAEFDKWEQQCLPIGNGYMGASFFGGISKEKIVLNEKTLWTGGPSKYRPDYYGGNKRNVYPYVKKVQKLLYDGEYKKALEILPELTGLADGFGAYQLLADLYIEQRVDETAAKNYLRELDMDRSLFITEFSVNDVKFKREAFADYPSNVICLKLSADKAKSLDFTLYFGETQENAVIEYNDGGIELYGEIPDNQLRYHACVKLETDGNARPRNDLLAVENASRAVLYICAATDYSPKFSDNYRSGEDPAEKTISRAEKAAKIGFDLLYKEHFEDHSALFGRCSVSFNNAGGEPDFVDKLVEGYKDGDLKSRSQLEELYFQFGRYMLISSSRSGSLPANLQGVWNESNTPPWNCDYHINVNLQMNYWPAYTANLAETVRPLADFIDELRAPGRITAKEYFNIVSDEKNPENGWTAHTAVNIFGWTAPGWDFYWGWSTAAAAWLIQNIWEYYEFTGDKTYLEQKIYPIMLESVKFYSQQLIYDDKQNRLVSTPTYSPEHGPVTVGNTYEQSLIKQLYLDFVKASEILGRDEKLREKIRSDAELLKPYSIGKTGLVKEWREEDEIDFDRSKIQRNHRHISHLMGLYPGKEITSASPDLMRAAVNTLNDRGDQSTGWARAYKLNLWARTGDGNRAYSIFSGLLSDCTFVNLFDFHPPFQLDGNFGGTAGVAEMLLQSHEGFINPLPSLPDEWSEGEFKGLCARNGFTVNAAWNEKRLTKLEIFSALGGEAKVKCGAKRILCGGKEIPFSQNEIVSFETEIGQKYIFEF